MRRFCHRRWCSLVAVPIARRFHVVVVQLLLLHNCFHIHLCLPLEDATRHSLGSHMCKSHTHSQDRQTGGGTWSENVNRTQHKVCDTKLTRVRSTCWAGCRTRLFTSQRWHFFDVPTFLFRCVCVRERFNFSQCDVRVCHASFVCCAPDDSPIAETSI